MIPICVTARMRGPMTGAPMLDGLLAFVVARRAGLVAGFGPMQTIEIPVAREPGGRFHLCSSAVVEWVAHERRFINRRFPVAEAQLPGMTPMRRVNLSAGPCRSYRLPGDVAFAEDDAVRWYLVGDRDAVEDLLGEVTHLGKRRGAGRGAVARWEVEPCEPWGDGFPIVREGKPMRPLPVDWPGLVEPTTGYNTLSFPYYEHTAEQLCAVPG